MLRNYKKLGSAIALSLMVAAANAGVSATEAAKIGKTLTPVGAEKAGNGGEISAWNGGVTTPPAGYTVGQKHVDPFAADKVKYTITAANYKDYADKLSEGQKAMFEKYPDTYRMPVYPTRRSSAYPQEIYDASKKNATDTSLVEGGNGLNNYVNGVPFGTEPIEAEVVKAVGVDRLERTIVLADSNHYQLYHQ